jgi:hypothetical protein
LGVINNVFVKIPVAIGIFVIVFEIVAEGNRKPDHNLQDPHDADDRNRESQNLKPRGKNISKHVPPQSETFSLPNNEAEKQMQDLSFTFTPTEANEIVAALSARPYVIAAPIITKMQAQAAAQTQPVPEAGQDATGCGTQE